MGTLPVSRFDAVPPPLKLGRRLAWQVESVDAWIDAKVAEAHQHIANHQEFMLAPARKEDGPLKQKPSFGQK